MLQSTATKEFLETVSEIESRGYWVEWAPSLSGKDTIVWMKLAGKMNGKLGANAALMLAFLVRGLYPVCGPALNIGGEAPQLGQLAPDLAVFAHGERQSQLGGDGRVRHSRLVVEIEWLGAATVALNKADTYLSDTFYGPDDTRVLEVWIVLIPKIPPSRPEADLLLPGAAVPLGPLYPFEGILPVGVGVIPPAVMVYFSRNNMFYEPAYAPVLWDHMVHVPAGPLGIGAFSANDFLNRAYPGKCFIAILNNELMSSILILYFLCNLVACFICISPTDF